MDVKKKALKGIKWTTISTILTTTLHFAQVSLMARLLDPADFGLMAMAMVVIGFAQSFKDMGTSAALIHYQEISTEQLNTLYWLNIVTGLALFLIVAGLAPLIAMLYQEQALTGVIAWSALALVIQAFGQQYRVLFQKALDFKKIEWIDIVSRGLNLLTAVGLAVWGLGVYAIVYGNLLAAAFSSIMLVWLGRSMHLPRFYFHWKGIRPFFSFGLYQIGERIVNYLSANFDKMLIGKWLGMEMLGFYNMAWQFIIFPLSKINPVVNKVAFPVYARLQANRSALSRYYQLSLQSLTLITVPLLAFLFFFAFEVIAFFYGAGWETSAALVQILVVVGMLKGLGNPGGAIVLALGRADVGFWWNVVWAAAVVLSLTIGFYIQADVFAISLALLLANILGTSVWHYIVHRISRVAYRDSILTFFKTLTFSIGGLLLVRWIMAFSGIDQFGLLPILLLGALIFTLLYGAYLAFFEKPLLAQARSLFQKS